MCHQWRWKTQSYSRLPGHLTLAVFLLAPSFMLNLNAGIVLEMFSLGLGTMQLFSAFWQVETFCLLQTLSICYMSLFVTSSSICYKLFSAFWQVETLFATKSLFAKVSICYKSLFVTSCSICYKCLFVTSSSTCYKLFSCILTELRLSVCYKVFICYKSLFATKEASWQGGELHVSVAINTSIQVFRIQLGIKLIWEIGSRRFF